MPDSFTLSEVVQAFTELGGEADWRDVEDLITKKRGNDYAPYQDWLNFKNTMFQKVQEHCEGYAKFTGDVQFVKVGKNRFRLATKSQPAEFTEQPSDFAPPERVQVNVRRIIRDTVQAKVLKELYQYKCQVQDCDFRIEPVSGRYYIEVHHVKPLGGIHNGPDTHGNMLVLCPNHHAMFDFGIPRFVSHGQILIGETNYILTCRHRLMRDVTAYHNEHIYRKITTDKTQL